MLGSTRVQTSYVSGLLQIGKTAITDEGAGKLAYEMKCSQPAKWDDPALGPLFQYKKLATSPSPQSHSTGRPDSPGGTKLWIILGCVLGGVALLTIILSTAWVMLRRDRARRSRSRGAGPSELLGHDARRELHGRSRGRPPASRQVSELRKWPEELDSDLKEELDGDHKLELRSSPASSHRFEMSGTPRTPRFVVARQGRPRATLRSELSGGWDPHTSRGFSDRCCKER